MISISLCIVTDDDCNSLESSLSCMKDIVEEIIVVTTRPSEKIEEIAARYDAKVHISEGIFDMVKARNLSFEKASMDYLLWMDTTDVIGEDEKKKLVILKESLDASFDTVTMLHRLVLNEEHMEAVRIRRVQIVRNSDFNKWHAGVYEHLHAVGNTIDTDIEIVEKSPVPKLNRNLLFIENTIELGAELTPGDLFYYASELFNIHQNETAIEYFEKFLDNRNGSIEDKLQACYLLADYYSRMNNKSKEIDTIIKSFAYALPRAEFCCRLGGIYIGRNEYDKAAFWYETAIKANKPQNAYRYYNDVCWTWLPHMQLCVCYFYLGEYKKSYDHNEIALKYKPNDDRMLSNKEFMENFLKEYEKKNFIISEKVKDRLRIVQVSPNFITVPPKNYGGIERVVYDLTEELVKMGHEVYLYAPQGSSTSAHLIPYQLNAADISDFVLQTLPVGIDLIHDHTHPSYVGVKKSDLTTVCTIHDTRLNPVKYPVYLSKRALQVIGGNSGYYVYNGIDINEYEFCENKEDYLLFMGELRWHKGILHALDIAERTGQKLVIAGPVFYWDYFENEIKPRLKRNPKVQYVGPVGGKERQILFKKARCMIFPTSWEEPFGLVMIEAMACGTPVIALSNGAVTEVMDGFPEHICHSIDEMVDKVESLELPNSKKLREYVAKNFSVRAMAESYVELYRKIMGGEV